MHWMLGSDAYGSTCDTNEQARLEGAFPPLVSPSQAIRPHPYQTPAFTKMVRHVQVTQLVGGRGVVTRHYVPATRGATFGLHKTSSLANNKEVESVDWPTALLPAPDSPNAAAELFALLTQGYRLYVRGDGVLCLRVAETLALAKAGKIISWPRRA